MSRPELFTLGNISRGPRFYASAEPKPAPAPKPENDKYVPRPADPKDIEIPPPRGWFGRTPRS